MQLRSRKRTSNFSANEHSDSSDQADNFIQLDDLSDSETYVPSSDSDLGEEEILDLNHKAVKPAPITISDFTEPPTNRGNGEQILSEQNESQFDFNVSTAKKRNNTKRKKKARSGQPLMWEVWEQEHEKWIDENLTVDVDLDQQNAVITETSDASSDLIIPLLRYQKEWLAWALKQEDSNTKGGILADEMGMGKTIQAIALVLAKRQVLHTIGEPNVSSQTAGSSTDLPRIRCTLVICPVVAVSQWVSEIDRFTSRGSAKVLVYHGANRGKNVKQFSEYDFVITTYSIVEAEYRKFMMPPKEKCPYCGKSFHQKKLSVHLKYYCGPDAIKTENQSKQERKKPKSMFKSGKKHASNYEADSRKRGSKKKAKHNRANNKEEKTQYSVITMEAKWLLFFTMAALMAVANGQESVKPLVKIVKGKKLCDKGWECKGWSQFCCNQTISDYFQTYQFENLFAKRNTPVAHAVGFWDYHSFITAAAQYQPHGFGTTGGKLQSMKEVAAFLGHVGSKTSCGYGVATGGPLAWGLCYNKEMSPSKLYCDDYYKYTYPCTPGVSYHGRGALPIYWNYNYGETGDALKVDLLNHPEYIENNATLAFQAALWRWMTPVKKHQPSAHDVFVGSWKPTKNDTLAKRVPGFGATMNVLYGDQVCGRGDVDTMNNIISHYLSYLDLMGVGREEAGPHEVLTCEEQKPFTVSPSSASSSSSS